MNFGSLVPTVHWIRAVIKEKSANQLTLLIRFTGCLNVQADP